MSDTNTVTIPAQPIKLSDNVQLDVARIHTASWPGLISGVLRNLSSEASRAVINRMQREFAEGKWPGFSFVADTKSNRDAGKTPTSLDDAKTARAEWRKSNATTYDAWMTEAEQALVDTIYDGTFRVSEPGESRAASLSPIDALARDNGRMEFDTQVLPAAGVIVPTDKAGKPLPVKHKKLAGIIIPTKSGNQLDYSTALDRYLVKHRERHVEAAKKELDRKARDAAKNVAATGAGLDL